LIPTTATEEGINVGFGEGRGDGIVGIIVGAAVGYMQHPIGEDMPVKSD